MVGMVGRMAKKQPKPKTPIPTDLEEFQSQYGGDWLKITQHPAFIAGTQLLNIRKLKSVTSLSDEQIEKNGREILADLRGHMKHEDDLFTLHTQSESAIPVEEQEFYVSPEEAAQLEAQVDKFRENRKKQYYAG
jgi:hypothetical protein